MTWSVPSASVTRSHRARKRRTVISLRLQTWSLFIRNKCGTDFFFFFLYDTFLNPPSISRQWQQKCCSIFGLIPLWKCLELSHFLLFISNGALRLLTSVQHVLIPGVYRNMTWLCTEAWCVVYFGVTVDQQYNFKSNYTQMEEGESGGNVFSSLVQLTVHSVIQSA